MNAHKELLFSVCCASMLFFRCIIHVEQQQPLHTNKHKNINQQPKTLLFTFRNIVWLWDVDVWVPSIRCELAFFRIFLLLLHFPEIFFPLLPPLPLMLLLLLLLLFSFHLFVSFFFFYFFVRFSAYRIKKLLHGSWFFFCCKHRTK